jgi:hypothetical protein
MRTALLLDDNTTTAWAAEADSVGSFAVGCWLGDTETSSVVSAAVVATTTTTRVAVGVRLGLENPITLAEELAVLDNISAGRVIAVVDTGDLDLEGAREDLGLLVAGLSARPIQHAGARWTVPSGVMGPDMPKSLIVTPEPTQLEVPVWLVGTVAQALSDETGYPVVADDAGQPLTRARVQPAILQLTGDLADDRDAVIGWAAAGASHLFLRMPSAAEPALLRGYVALHLAPEVAMVNYPRVMSHTLRPLESTEESATVSADLE